MLNADFMENRDCCDDCPFFRLLPDPDPNDWFRDLDMKAVCHHPEIMGVIDSSLEKPSEWTNIQKPPYCPYLGHQLSKEEQRMAPILLKIAQSRMK